MPSNIDIKFLYNMQGKHFYVHFSSSEIYYARKDILQKYHIILSHYTVIFPRALHRSEDSSKGSRRGPDSHPARSVVSLPRGVAYNNNIIDYIE